MYCPPSPHYIGVARKGRHLCVALLNTLGTALNVALPPFLSDGKLQPLLTAILLKTSLRKRSVFTAVERVNTIQWLMWAQKLRYWLL